MNTPGSTAENLDFLPTMSEDLAAFVERASCEDLSPEALEALKVRVLDSIGCAYGALGGGPIRMLREHIREFGGNPRCTLIGGGKTSPDRAALYNGALVRYLDFNDSYLAPGETCHPSDNLGAVLAASEYAMASGRQFLAALAVAYQVQCRLSDVAPLRSRGFDHVTQGAFAVAAGVAKALRLPPSKTAAALGISGTANNALRVTRTGGISHWKGLAYPNTGFAGLHAAFLAMRGITGPREVFEGTKGWMQSVSGKFTIDWSLEDLERVTRTILKKYNAEVHSQAAIEAIIELREAGGFSGGDVDRIRIDIFDVAHLIIGGGAEGEKTSICTKEEADHSLPYLAAVAAIDGRVEPEQFEPERIGREDVQSLLHRVTVVPDREYSRRFPAEHACKVTVSLKDGTSREMEKSDYEGFHTRPMSWERVVGKFSSLCAEVIGNNRRDAIIETVERLDRIQVSDLVRILW